MKGTENSMPTMKIKRSRSACCIAIPSKRKTTRFFRPFSLNAPWNCVITSDQNPSRHALGTAPFALSVAASEAVSTTGKTVAWLIAMFDKLLQILGFCTSWHEEVRESSPSERTLVTSWLAPRKQNARRSPLLVLLWRPTGITYIRESANSGAHARSVRVVRHRHAVCHLLPSLAGAHPPPATA